MEQETVRWKQRLETFAKALRRMTEVVDESKRRTLNEFEEDSIIQRFEFTLECAWKLMMSYEKDAGIRDIMGPKGAIRHAFSLGLIENGEAWLEMVEDRNVTSHNYDEERAEVAIDHIVNTFHPLLTEFYQLMQGKCTD